MSRDLQWTLNNYGTTSNFVVTADKNIERPEILSRVINGLIFREAQTGIEGISSFTDVVMMGNGRDNNGLVAVLSDIAGDLRNAINEEDGTESVSDISIDYSAVDQVGKIIITVTTPDGTMYREEMSL